jgi:hypothetical protein
MDQFQPHFGFAVGTQENRALGNSFACGGDVFDLLDTGT